MHASMISTVSPCMHALTFCEFKEGEDLERKKDDLSYYTTLAEHTGMLKTQFEVAHEAFMAGLQPI